MTCLARWIVVLVFALSSGAMAQEGAFYDVTLLDCHDGDTCRMIIPYLPAPSSGTRTQDWCLPLSEIFPNDPTLELKYFPEERS